jgi:hypothetical protein
MNAVAPDVRVLAKDDTWPFAPGAVRQSDSIVWFVVKIARR